MISCDKCHKGYHFTCLREVLEVPVEQWLCPGCKVNFFAHWFQVGFIFKIGKD